MSKIELLKGDITKLKVDAIVNAANNSLLGGGGVDGAIHDAAGPGLLEECLGLNGCETGLSKITKGYNLPARYVIHTVGPIWTGGNNNENHLLRCAYLNSLETALKYEIKTIAFPNISTGVFGFPKQSAADIAIDTVNNFLLNQTQIEIVYFVVFDEENYLIYQKQLNGSVI